MDILAPIQSDPGPSPTQGRKDARCYSTAWPYYSSTTPASSTVGTTPMTTPVRSTVGTTPMPLGTTPVRSTLDTTLMPLGTTPVRSTLGTTPMHCQPSTSNKQTMECTGFAPVCFLRNYSAKQLSGEDSETSTVY